MDLSKCFDTLDHDPILQGIRKRIADDIVILTRTRKAAENAKRRATEFLEGKLKLTVNLDKTHIVHSSDGVKFLGVVIHTRYTRIQDKNLKGFMDKIRNQQEPYTRSVRTVL